MKKKIKELSIEAAAVARQENEMVVREERNTQVEKLQVRKYVYFQLCTIFCRERAFSL